MKEKNPNKGSHLPDGIPTAQVRVGCARRSALHCGLKASYKQGRGLARVNSEAATKRLGHSAFFITTSTVSSSCAHSQPSWKTLPLFCFWKDVGRASHHMQRPGGILAAGRAQSPGSICG